MILKTLKFLENMSSTNGKVELIKHNDSLLLQRVLFMALNKYLRYGFKSLPEPILSSKTIELSEALDFVQITLQGNQRSKEREHALAKIMGQLSEADCEVLSRVILKDLKCGVGGTLVNKAIPKLIPKFDVLLAKPGKEKNLKKLNYPCMAQIKYDGARVNIDIDNDGVQTAFTRNGNIMNLFGRFDNDFPDNANHNMIDGECVAYDKNGKRIPRKLSNGIITKATRGTLTAEDAAKLRFIAWDIVDRDNFKNQETQLTPCLTRYENVKKLLEGYSDIIEVAESIIVNSFEEALAYYEKCIENGEEGILLKNMDGVWELKRSNNLVKMKAENDADLIIVALNEGSGTRKGRLGSFTLETSDGKLRVNCGTGLSEKQTIEYFDDKFLGMIVEMTYNELISNKKNDMMSMFLPVFQRIRYDKEVANTLEELV